MFNVRFTSDDVHSLCGLQGDSSVSYSYRLVSKLLNKKTAGINTDVHTPVTNSEDLELMAQSRRTLLLH